MSNDMLKDNALFGESAAERVADPRFVRQRRFRSEQLSHPGLGMPDRAPHTIDGLAPRLRIHPGTSESERAKKKESRAVSLADATQRILSTKLETDPAIVVRAVAPVASLETVSSQDIPYLTTGLPVADPGVEVHSTPFVGISGATAAAAPSETPGPPARSLSGVGAHDQTCSICSHANTSTARFCVECGSLLLFGRRHQHDYKQLQLEPSANAAIPNTQINAQLIAINDDGSEGDRIPLNMLETTIGREANGRFGSDSFLSPQHAKLIVEGHRLYIQDLESLNGTFIKLRQERIVSSGDTFLMGRQVLLFEEIVTVLPQKHKAADGTRRMGSPSADSSYRLLQIGVSGALQNVYCLPKLGAQLGRERGDIIFPQDKFMSSRHAQIYRRPDGAFILADLNSSNGTWIKIWELTELTSQDYIFMGQQLFRVLIDR